MRVWRVLSPAINIPSLASVVMESFPTLVWASLCSPWGNLQHEAERTALNGFWYFINLQSKAGFGCDRRNSCESTSVSNQQSLSARDKDLCGVTTL